MARGTRAKKTPEAPKVEIGAGITTVGSFSFYGCLNLKEVVFAEDCAVTTINKGAFGLTGITEITIPAAVTTIADYAFYNNASLENVMFAENSKLTSIGKYALFGGGCIDEWSESSTVDVYTAE